MTPRKYLALEFDVRLVREEHRSKDTQTVRTTGGVIRIEAVFRGLGGNRDQRMKRNRPRSGTMAGPWSAMRFGAGK